MKPFVTIVLATYKPNPQYLEEQLESINQQDYQNLEVLIRDDSDDQESFLLVSELAERILTNRDWKIERNNQNLGSNRTFELLTLSANGDYIAYCDQDDIWEPYKISILVEKMEHDRSVLCYSDLAVIDGDGNHVADSFRKVNKRVKHVYGDNLFKFLLRRNSVTGCTMLIRADVAKKSIPFCHEFYVHDHWLALCASTYGSISYVGKQLVQYRIHGNNQIGAGILKDINNRTDYLNKKLVIELSKYNYLLNHFNCDELQYSQIKELRDWTQIRIKSFNRNSYINFLRFLKGFKEDLQLTLFELVINYVPEKILTLLFKRIKHTN